MHNAGVMDPLALFAIALLSVSIPTSAAKLYCSIHPARDTPASAFAGLSRISPDDASKAALASIKAPSKQLTRRNLEVEQGCLVYSFGIQISGKKTVEEILVDAGTGIVIVHKHETANLEQAERARGNTKKPL